MARIRKTGQDQQAAQLQVQKSRLSSASEKMNWEIAGAARQNDSQPGTSGARDPSAFAGSANHARHKAVPSSAGSPSPPNAQQAKRKGSAPDQPLNFYSTDPLEEGRLRHFLRQLARLCQLRGDMIPKAQEALLGKFFLHRRDRHHLQQMSNAHALRSEEAFNNGNARLALLERLEAWRKMPKDVSLLLDLAEACLEPGNLNEERAQRKAKGSPLRVKNPDIPEAAGVRPGQTDKHPEQARSQSADRQTVKKRRKAQQALRRREQKAARQLFQLNAWQHRRQVINYLKKAVELSIGLEREAQSREGARSRKVLREEASRLRQLQQNYPGINWERYAQRIRSLNGRPRKRWPWVLLLAAVLAAVALYLPQSSWLPWRGSRIEKETFVQEAQFSEQSLLDNPVPVDWSVPPDQDPNFDKMIQKSQHLKLGEYYAYEVQGHIRVKPGRVPDSSANIATGPERWQHLQPAPPFGLFLTYEHQGRKEEKRISFSYGLADDPATRAPVMEGDTVLFREVFRLPEDLDFSSDDRLSAKIVTTGQAPRLHFVDLSEGGFAQTLSSINTEGNSVPTVAMAFRNKVMISDGEQVRLLGYDIELQNKARRPLDQLDLRLSWREEDGMRSKSRSPILLQRDYSVVSASGSNLPGLARMTRRLWVEVPADLGYPVEELTPQVRIAGNILEEPQE